MSLRTVTTLRAALPRAGTLRLSPRFISSSTARLVSEREAELARVLETARRNVANGKRAPAGKDDCVRMAAFGKPGSGKV